jgi:hypothetical protein
MQRSEIREWFHMVSSMRGGVLSPLIGVFAIERLLRQLRKSRIALRSIQATLAERICVGRQNTQQRSPSRGLDNGASMVNSGQSFREFEQAGWEDPGVVTGYHEHLSGVTTQSADVLLDAACVGDGSRVLESDSKRNALLRGVG